MLEEKSTVLNTEIMDRFGVSIGTVRRDLAYLEAHGVLERVYGGAVKKKYLQTEPGYKKRLDTGKDEKARIAAAAQKLIDDKDAVFFDIGTTVGFVAEQIEKSKSITAFTNSLRTAISLAERNFDVILPGGHLRRDELALSGGMALRDMADFNIDKAIIGAAGVDKDGITDFVESEAYLRREIIKNARQVIVVADHTKFSVRAMCHICDASEMDVLITDSKSPRKTLKELESQGTEIIIV